MRDFTGFKIAPTGINNKIVRRDVINYIVEKYQLMHYLEIGVRDPEATFNKVRCKNKTGVDPEPLGKEVNFPCTSDEFFDMIKDEEDLKFDIIFIDGLHLTEQVDKVIENFGETKNGFKEYEFLKWVENNEIVNNRDVATDINILKAFNPDTIIETEEENNEIDDANRKHKPNKNSDVIILRLEGLISTVGRPPSQTPLTVVIPEIVKLL